MKHFLTFILLISSLIIKAQSVNAPLNPDYYHWIDRYEMESNTISQDIHTSFKPYQRVDIAAYMSKLRKDKWSKVDEYNLHYLASDNWEFMDSINNEGRTPIFNRFYRVESDLYHVDEPDFGLHVNPVLYLGAGMETANDENTFINTRGVQVRGQIDKKLGFYTFIGENQIIFPSYVRDYINENIVVPHEGFWKDFKDNGVDFFTARGYISFDATKHINLQFGHDRFKIGNGYRSMILSDNTPAYLFLKMNTQVWKINYTNLFTELTADVFGNAGGLIANDQYPSKYMALHHLSINVSEKLNIGLFESVIYGADSVGNSADFDLQYLNPIIFYRALEQQGGSPDNVLLGLDFKWLAFKKVSLYGQLVLDEFLLENIREGNGWWANKFGVQIGGEYVDAFGINNLDLQAEANISRPYTYSHSSPYGSYSHYEQSLAHPLGANFTEFVGVIRYQPAPKWYVQLKAIKSNFGSDPAGQNFGGDILKNNVTREMNFGNEIGQGINNDLYYGNATISFQWRHNFFIDLSHTYRKVESEDVALNASTNYTSAAIRWNIPQRLNEF